MANLSKITIGAEEQRFLRQKTVSDKCVYKDRQKQFLMDIGKAERVN